MSADDRYRRLELAESRAVAKAIVAGKSDTSLESFLRKAHPGLLRILARKWMQREIARADRERVQETERAAVVSSGRREPGREYDDTWITAKQRAAPVKRALYTSVEVPPEFLTERGAISSTWWQTPAGQSERRAQHEAERPARDELSAIVGYAIDRFASGLRMQWNAELLGSSFSLGDGSQVTWGGATVADHQARLALLEKQVSGTVETAARHAAAIRDIQAAGVNRLAELTA